jgi:hypothetical protein
MKFDIEVGEHADQLLQGLTRGCMRLADGDTCPPCWVWLRAPVNRGIDQKLLRFVFPDSSVRPWYPLGKQAKTVPDRAVEFISATLFGTDIDAPLEDDTAIPYVGPEDALLTEQARAYCGVKDRHNFRKLIPEIDARLGAKAVPAINPSNGRRIGWRRAMVNDYFPTVGSVV